MNRPRDQQDDTAARIVKPRSAAERRDICRVGRHTGQPWRSSWCTGRSPVGLQDNTDVLQVLGRHHVPEGHVGIVRRIEADVLMPQDDPDPPGHPWQLGHYPAWWQTAAANTEWDWFWNIGHTHTDVGLLMHPGLFIQTRWGWGREFAAGFVNLDYCDDWQRLGSWLHSPMGNGSNRYMVEGPCTIVLLALWAWNDKQLGPMAIPRPFGPNLGCIEGVDVRASEFRKGCDPAWIVP